MGVGTARETNPSGVAPAWAMFNLHYLELFYYLARHRGVSEAARQMPYGVQPSTISRQVAYLEEQVGSTLFERRPFALTPTGQQLYGFVREFFDQLPSMADSLRRGLPVTVRVGGAPVALREYLPPVFREVRATFPELHLVLKEGLPAQIAEWLARGAIDLAVTILEETVPEHYVTEPLVRLPFVLLVPARSSLRNVAAIWRRPKSAPVLVGPHHDDAISRAFRKGLAGRGVHWPVGLEVNSLELVETLVLNGFGLGLSVEVPGRKLRAGLRALPFRDLPPLQVGMIWQLRPQPAVEALASALRKQARYWR